MSLQEASQVVTKKVIITTSGGDIDVTSLFDTIEIFDSIFTTQVSGHIVITDALGLSGKLSFDGTDVITIQIGKSSQSDIAETKKAYRIYKQGNRRNVNQTSERYVLYFVSNEMIFSEQQTVNQSFVKTYSDIANSILSNQLKVSQEKVGIIDESTKIKKVVIPELKPLKAISWCASRATDTKDVPSFLFFENNNGFNFVTLSTLNAEKSVLDINFNIKNLGAGGLLEMSSAKSFEIVTQDDLFQKIKNGAYAGSFLGFDPVTRSYDTKTITFDDVYNKIEHANEYPLKTEVVNPDQTSTLTSFDSKHVLSIFNTKRTQSKYIKAKDSASFTTDEDYASILLQRQNIIYNLVSNIIKISLPGNFQLTSGVNVNVFFPGFNKREKSIGDESVTGKYLITGARQIIGLQKHDTIIEVATDSTNSGKNRLSSPEQKEALEESA